MYHAARRGLLKKRGMYLLEKTAFKRDKNTVGDTDRGVNQPASFSVLAEVFKFQHVKQQAG